MFIIALELGKEVLLTVGGRWGSFYSAFSRSNVETWLLANWHLGFLIHLRVFDVRKCFKCAFMLLWDFQILERNTSPELQ